MSPMAVAVGVVFSPGGKVYSFDPGDLELAWNEQGHLPDLARPRVRARRRGRTTQIADEARRTAEAGRPAGHGGRRPAQVQENRDEAKRAMRAFREPINKHERRSSRSPPSSSSTAPGSCFAYGAEGEVETRRMQEELAQPAAAPGRAARGRAAGAVAPLRRLRALRHAALLHPLPFPRAADRAQDGEGPGPAAVVSGRITGLCGRLRCCLAYEHPLYRSFRDRAPRVGGRVETPAGPGVVKVYEVLKDACVVALDDERKLEIADRRLPRARQGPALQALRATDGPLLHARQRGDGRSR